LRGQLRDKILQKFLSGDAPATREIRSRPDTLRGAFDR
jgi:hypothetical protein